MKLLRNILAPLFVAILGFYGPSNAHAASISFDDTSILATVGDTIMIDFMMDFTDDPTLGGGTDIFYDMTVLSFVSFDFGTTTLALDPSFSRLPDVLTNELNGLAFGNFAGISGPGMVGTLTFQAIAAGDIALTMAETDLAGGAFTSATTFGPQVVNFGSAAVSVSQVPLPAAVWLFGSGLLGLAGMAKGRRHSKT